MSIPLHYINIYTRPAQNSLAGVFTFRKRYPIYNYQHVITNQGWFDTASLDLAIRSTSEGNDLLNNYLGSFVQIVVDNPVQPIWEGLINRITFNSGGASYTISMEEMANRVSCLFVGAANAAGETVVMNNVVMQAVYGIKQDQIEFGPDPTGGAATQRAQLRDTILFQRAFPQTSVSQAQGQTNLVHLELIGIFHTLEWEKPFSALVGTNTVAATTITNILGALANGAIFFDNTNLTKVTANAGLTIPDQQRGQSQWERIQKIAEAGDGANYWVAGIIPTPYNYTTMATVQKNRIFYYRVANFAVEYTAFQRDGLKPRNAFGQRIPPWLVVPDRSIRVEDTLVGFASNLYGDPRLTYIQSVQYDMNSQQVQWFGADDTTARAAFQLKRAFKPIAKNMPGSAPLRTIVT